MGKQCAASKVKITLPGHFLNLSGIQPADENDRPAIKVSGPQRLILQNFYQTLYHIFTI